MAVRSVQAMFFFLWAATLFAPSPARADYYFPSYNNYGSYNRYFGGGEETPVISIDMDPQHLIDSSFRVAAREGRIDDMMQLVHQGANVNSTSEEGDTALMYASRNCSVEVASELMRLKANVNIRNKDGDTALIYATMESCLPAVKLLLKAPRLEFLVRDREGKNALDYAHEGAILDVDGPGSQISQLLQLRAHQGLNRWANRGPRK